MHTTEMTRSPAMVGSSILNRYAALARSMREEQGRVQNACGRCGATSYKSLMARDTSGVMRFSGQFQCVRCRRVFSQLVEWRDRPQGISGERQ